jgi:hypothetical protein
MKRLVALLAVVAMMVVATAMPVMAAPKSGPVVTGGLVNVTIVDAVDADRTTLQVPIAVAANVCDVDINVLAADLADDGQANCTATADSRAKNRN